MKLTEPGAPGIAVSDELPAAARYLGRCQSRRFCFRVPRCYPSCSLLRGRTDGVRLEDDPFATGFWPAPDCRDGVLVGAALRKVTASADGLSVDHLTLDLNGPGAKGKGFAGAFWAHSLARYRALGVARLFVTAADEGRTFWAREPFRFEDPRRPRGLIDVWCRPGTEEPAGRDVLLEHATGLGFPSDAFRRFLKGVEEEPSLYTPSGLCNSEFGRLLLRGATWRGVADLRPGQLTA